MAAALKKKTTFKLPSYSAVAVAMSKLSALYKREKATERFSVSVSQVVRRLYAVLCTWYIVHSYKQ